MKISPYFNAVRLAAFALGYGLTGALTGGTLNRIMVAEFGLPVSLVGLFFASSLFISPLRTWMGYRSDGHPVKGLRREPYMMLGAALSGIGIILAIVLLINTANSPLLLVMSVMVAFLIHEFGRNLSHNSFQALLSDKFSGHGRARAMTVYEIITLLGLVMGAGGIAGALRIYDPARLISVTIGVAIVTFGLSVFAALRNEPYDALTRTHIETARSKSFRHILREIALEDRQVRLFFLLIVFVIVGTLAQDVLLEPYGALVLNMDVAETSRLTMYWGLGVMAAMLVSGVLLIRYLGQLMVLRMGLVMTIAVFLGVMALGAAGYADAFRLVVLVMGLGTGLAGAGLLTAIINFTTPVRAGLLLGVWGFAMVLGRSLGSLFGGVIVDILSLLTANNYWLAYGAVFTLEAVLLGVALVLTMQLQVNDSTAYQEKPLVSQPSAV